MALEVVWTHLSFQADFVQFASFDEPFCSIFHQEKADAMSRGPGLSVCNRNHDHYIAHPTISDEHLEKKAT